jgi:hypothetical protein
MKQGYEGSFEFWAAFFALIAAAFWIWSGCADAGFSHQQQMNIFAAYLRKSTHLNAIAALFSGLSAAAVVGLLLHRATAR